MKLSIITINYNNRDGLQKTIDSVICQTFQDFEWIVIDGGSTDGSKELIEKNSDKINYWVSEPDKGIYNAMNKGTKIAQGEYCLYLNSGDALIDSGVLDKIFSSNPTEKIFWGQACIGLTKDKIGINTNNFTPFQILKTGPAHQATFFSRELMNKIGGYDESYLISADMKCIYRYLLIENASHRYFDFVISEMQKDGISYLQRELCLEENKRLVSELFSNGFVADYYDWLKLNEEIVSLRNTMRSYKIAIEIYNARKNNSIIRLLFKISYFFYKIKS